MQHSYEGLDRSGGFARAGLLAPLRHRDFRLLMGGMSVSLLGDGLFIVALAWQVYAVSNAPTALASVGIAMTVPTITCLLLGGAVSDRFDRRRVMLVADSVRAIALGALAALSLTGVLALWHLMVIGVVYGAATAFFDPSSDALVPELLPADLLAQANSLNQLIRPVALRLAGPALGGGLVAALGAGGAFGVDATSFLISAAALLAMSRTHHPRAAAGEGSTLRQVAAGMRYVRRQPWLWATLVSAALAYLLFMGPTEVLLPFVVKNELHGGAGALGLVFAAGGFGSLICALAIGTHGLPARSMTFIYATWTAATVAVAGYGIAHALWGLMLVSFAFNGLETAGTIAWATAKQRHVPIALLGRVSSLDWLISIGLLPLSFALTGPVSSALGARTTLVGAGLLGALVTAAALLVPGVREIGSEPARARPRGLAFVAAPVKDIPKLRLVGDPAATWLSAPQPASLAHHGPSVTPAPLSG
ncbi:MAG TPA: MFS transporter [Solirubrobacteraceae bacterium]|jgi:DHA3 family tetracycline resistance protein-like MFS transporter|nr:MFS transporter [Solirubrobacteraceae bacterium]